jgi:uncharacterized protein (TIGR03435 family)
MEHAIDPARRQLFLFAAAAPPGQSPAFEVVSVKPARIELGQRAINPVCVNGNYHAPLRGVAASIRFAYNLATYHFTGMPAWASKQEVAVRAKRTLPSSPS